MESFNWLNAVGLLLTVETTLIGFIWYFAWWLSKKFNSIYDRIQKTLDTMITKLEYHEKHDDQRFSQLTDGLWALRVENASQHKRLNKDIDAFGPTSTT